MTSPPPTSAFRLALLYRVTQTFGSSLDLGEVLNLVMDEVIAAVKAERGFVVLRDADTGRLEVRAARGLEHRSLDAPEFQFSRGVVERVAGEGAPILTSDAQTDARLKLRESVMLLGLRSILCVPLKLKTEISGVIYVDNRVHAGLFTEADLDLLQSIALSAAIAIENARLYQVAVEKGRLERELQLARDVQSSFLPRGVPRAPGWEFATRWQPARQVAGDYFDFIPAADHPRLGLVIGDVSDKGMPAALFMALTRATVRASLAAARRPADGIGQANRLLCADSPNGMFVTLFYGQLDLAASSLTFVNAGHNPPWLYRASVDRLESLTLTGMALGIDDTVEYGQRSLPVLAGDVLLLYTDGVTDALSGHEEFGPRRLEALVREHARAPAAEIAAALQARLHEFSGDAPPVDDVTYVVVKRL
jgi:sigma-B regulation protein RsbU (phosphoserine phosphatase)